MKKFAFLLLVFLIAALFAFWRRPQAVTEKLVERPTAPVEAAPVTSPPMPPRARVAVRPRRPAASAPVVERARNLVAQQRPQEAAQILEKEVGTNPENLDAHLELGFLYAELDPTSERSEQAFRRVLEGDPNNKIALEELLQKYVANNRFEEGNRLIEQLKKSSSDPGYLEAQRGALLLDQGRIDDARATYDRLAQNPAERERALPGLAEAYMRSHEYGQAVSAYEEIVKDLSKKPESAEQLFDTQVALVQALAADGNTDGAQSLFQEFRKESPQHPAIAHLLQYFH